MKQDNKTTRELALEWWRNTTILECQELAQKYKPDWPYDLVRTSSSTIERIYLAEQAKKEADLTEGSPDSTNPVHLFLVEENRRLKKLLHDLTPGGSEFANDPEYCAKWIAENRTEHHYQMANQIRARNERIEVLEDALKWIEMKSWHKNEWTEMEAINAKAKEALNQK